MGFRDAWRRLTGRDRIEASEGRLAATDEETDEERSKRLAILAKNSRQSAENLRAAGLLEAAALERERAEALEERRERVEERRKAARAEAERLRVEAARRSYGIPNGRTG